MGRKLSKAEPQPAAADDGLTAVHPHVRITVAGREVTVREYGFFEGLEVADRARDFIAELCAPVQAGALQYGDVRRLSGRHREVVVAMLAQSADVPTEWVVSLNRADTEVLLSTWFAVNCAFFMQEVVERLRRAPPSAHAAPIGSDSSPGSPAPGSEISTASEN